MTTPYKPRPARPILLIWRSRTRAERVHSVSQTEGGGWRCNCEAAVNGNKCWALDLTNRAFPNVDDEEVAQ